MGGRKALCHVSIPKISKDVPWNVSVVAYCNAIAVTTKCNDVPWNVSCAAYAVRHSRASCAAYRNAIAAPSCKDVPWNVSVVAVKIFLFKKKNKCVRELAGEKCNVSKGLD